MSNSAIPAAIPSVTGQPIPMATTTMGATQTSAQSARYRMRFMWFLATARAALVEASGWRTSAESSCAGSRSAIGSNLIEPHRQREVSRAKKHHPFRVNSDEYLLPDRQGIERRTAGDEPLIPPKNVHLSEVALENRLFDARRPHVAIAGGALRRNLHMHGTH